VKTRLLRSIHPTPPLDRLERELMLVRDRLLQPHWRAAKAQAGRPAVASRLLRCAGCGRTESRPAEELAGLARSGWPVCCGQSLSLVPELSDGPGQDRRTQQRRPARPGVRAEVRRGSLGMGADFGLGLMDVSGDGLRVRLRAPVRTGEVVEMTLWSADGATRIRARGRVVWCRPATGIGFVAGVRLRRRLTAGEQDQIAG
jgi:hypothetical protein